MEGLDDEGGANQRGQENKSPVKYGIQHDCTYYTPNNIEQGMDCKSCQESKICHDGASSGESAQTNCQGLKKYRQ